MNRSTPLYYLRAFGVFPGVRQKLDCLRGREYWWEGDAGTYLCIESRSCLLMYGRWEKEVKQVIREHAGGGLFLDIGANIGRLSVFAGRLGMDVVSLEPHRRAFKALEVNLKVNGVRGHALNLAAWSHDAMLPFYSGKSSALSNVFGPDVFGGGTELDGSVSAVAVDSLSLAPTVVKIDAERSELQILHGMGRTLERSHPVVIFESFEPTQCRAFLAKFGYQVRSLETRLLSRLSKVERNYVAV